MTASIFSAPTNGVPWLIRTDFTDQQAWNDVSSAAAADISDENTPPDQTFGLVDDPGFDRLTPEGLLDLDPCPTETFFLVDPVTMSHPERPILAVDVSDEPGRSFRLVPAQVRAFSENMLIGNMDFADFADGIDEDGIFRGFAAEPWTPAAPSVDTTPADIAGPAQESARQAADDDTVAPTITLAFGQRWPGDTRSVPAGEVPDIVWDPVPPPDLNDGNDHPPN